MAEKEEQEKLVKITQVDLTLWFDCTECGQHLHVTQALPDTIATGLNCISCDASYRAVWSQCKIERRA